MVVFSNHRLGPSAELFVSDEVALTMLRETAAAARPYAEARWEVELVLWLDSRADTVHATTTAARPAHQRTAELLDVGDIAWTPEHFDHQRAFVVDAIQRGARCGEHALAFDRWRRMIEVHPADSVQVGRRWQWPASRPVNPDLTRTNQA
jgi:hypothetical protein